MPLWDKASAEFCFAKSRELLTKPFPKPHPPHNSCRDLHLDDNYPRQMPLVGQFQNLFLDDPYYQINYRDRTLTKSENLARKTYNRCERNRSFLHDVHPPPPSPFNNVNRNGDCFTFPTAYESTYTPELGYDNVFSCRNTKCVPDNRPRALSFSDTAEGVPKKGRSIRDRNRRRQSYNPRAYESSSSDSECNSLGSVDLDWRRRKRLSRLSTSNSSIRSEMINRNRVNPHYLKPEFNSGKILGRSPPPSNSILSGLSPTTVSRCQRQNEESTSSDSSL